MMQQHHLYFQKFRKGEAEQLKQLLDSADSHHLPLLAGYDFWANRKTAKPTLLRLFLLFSLISCSLVFAPRVLLDPFPFFYSLGEGDNAELNRRTLEINNTCLPVKDNSICCDRTSFRTDVCYMRGDVRTHSLSNSILLHSTSQRHHHTVEERIRPYTRKWETSVMATIDELCLRTDSDSTSHCDVAHDVPAVVFSTGGYTGNVYHEFNDGILPLYITAQRYNRKVVFVLLEYHDWWITKYAEVLSSLSDYPPIDFSNDHRIHCFPEAIVGLRIHDELTINPSQMKDNKTIRDFRQLLDDAYKPRIQQIQTEQEEEQRSSSQQENSVETKKPKLLIVARNGSRSIENEEEVARVGKEVGFRVQVLRPGRTTELAKIYRALNECDAMVGVHGAALTHFLYMRPGAVFIQIVPLGTDWAADAYYGEPARKMGLRYLGYKILPRESSLSRTYDRNDPVLRDPDSVNAKGWDFTKTVYLDAQNVRLDLARFKKRLVRAHAYLVTKRRRSNSKQQTIQVGR